MKKTAMETLKAENKDLKLRLLRVAMLASDTPRFFNPLHVMEAKRIRDFVLANQEDYL
jgi:hypothetical protein